MLHPSGVGFFDGVLDGLNSLSCGSTPEMAKQVCMMVLMRPPAASGHLVSIDVNLMCFVMSVPAFERQGGEDFRAPRGCSAGKWRYPRLRQHVETSTNWGRWQAMKFAVRMR